MSKAKNNQLKYLVASDTDQLWGLFVTTIGFQHVAPRSVYPPKGHPSSYWFDPSTGRVLHEYQLIYVVKGEGVFQSAHVKRAPVTAGSLILLFPEEWHSFQPDKQTGWQVYWLGFNGRHAPDLMQSAFFNRQHALLDIGFNEQLTALFEQGITIAGLQQTGFQQMLAGITHHLLSFICYSKKNESFRDKDIAQQISKARMMMNTNAYEHMQPEAIARELNISYSWFRRVFKQYTGFSPAQYQLEIRLQKAKELLTRTTMPVKAIAYELNFESTSYFVTFFRNKVGMPPGIYREKVHARLQ
ncbi:MAG: AraC family transcriptional regulator [Candidatus Pseudobacter hemicellulosilyticus]|uniref:AraC family transcriptional regulator n=1 Tax=Candidatus Pseudobacter hemicellulosilyticus TaxID=3121375 RepID=A0AAJ5WSL2_9BACT|nr:MAG: AraC family transcriptional regulator [Pseudobacter sp.]